MSKHSSSSPENSSANFSSTLTLGALLIVATVVAYFPALHGGFLLDDGVNVTKPELRSLSGLWRIWFEPGATQQYYPFLYSAFWLEHRLWGDAVTGYHLANLLQHATAACLLVAIVRKLALPGAWLAGFIFALHPVCVESVAWIAEQKNTLSTAFFLGAGLAYLHFDRTRQSRHYVFALGLFLLALLSKTVTATLPAALLVVFWWQRGRLEWKRDIQPLLPWFALSVAVGLFSRWVEHRFVGAHGEDFALSFVERGLVAGHAVWFYFGKLLWPTNLLFMYPRWTLNSAAIWDYLFPLSVLLFATALGVLARRYRGPLAGFLIFLGLLFPMAGFFNIYWFRISYVADHFLYLPSIGLIVPLAVGIALLARVRWFFLVVCAALSITLGTMTWRQSRLYRDYETLSRETLARNPAAWMLHHNLGVAVAEIPGRLPEAIARFQETLRLKPNFAEAHFNLAQAWARVPGKMSEAIAEFETAARLEPEDVAAQFNLANALAGVGRLTEAIPHYEATVKLQPDFAEAYFNLGNALANTGRADEAARAFASALQLKPDSLEARYNLGCVLATIPGRANEARTELETVLRMKPDFAPAKQMLQRLKTEGQTKER